MASSVTLARAKRAYRREAWSVGLFSAAINLLMLTGSLYMLQVYDRVLASRSVPTLVALSLLALGAFVLQGALDAVRARLMARLAAQFDDEIYPAVARAATVLPLHGASPGEALQPQRDAEAIRTFLSGSGPTALIDLPFMPLFLIGCFVLHPWLGWLAVGGGVVILGLTLAVEFVSKAPTSIANRSLAEHHVMMESVRRNAGVVQALGMRGALLDRLVDLHRTAVTNGIVTADIASSMSALARTIRFVLQSAILGLGAYLAIRGDISAGVIIAASIMTSRALAPVELAVANWKGLIGTREGLRRLADILPLIEKQETPSALPAPRHSVSISDLSVMAPGGGEAIIRNVSFDLQAGQGLALIGPSGAGKSTLARAMAGIDGKMQGRIALDGAALDQWPLDTRGQHIGYLPQDVDLLDGTIAQNIARFRPDATMDDIVAAARLAGAHDLIVKLPKGYDMPVGESGLRLSGGQRQRIGLARALFGNPFLVILDEPNAHLDQEGDDALTHALRSLRARGAIVVLVTHKPAALAAVDLIGVMGDGRLAEFGPKDRVLQNIIRHTMPPGARPVPRPATGPEAVKGAA